MGSAIQPDTVDRGLADLMVGNGLRRSSTITTAMIGVGERLPQLSGPRAIARTASLAAGTTAVRSRAMMVGDWMIGEPAILRIRLRTMTAVRAWMMRHSTIAAAASMMAVRAETMAALP